MLILHQTSYDERHGSVLVNSELRSELLFKTK